MGSNSYYDVDSILMDQQKAPCTFLTDVENLGYLGGAPEAEADVKEGTKLEIPLWLGVTLDMSSYATMDMPATFSIRVVNALKADAKSVDLRMQCPHFFRLGAYLALLFEDADLAEVLSDAFMSRAASVADFAVKPRGAVAEGEDFLRGLDETERTLFRLAHESAKATKQWLNRTK